MSKEKKDLTTKLKDLKVPKPTLYERFTNWWNRLTGKSKIAIDPQFDVDQRTLSELKKPSKQETPKGEKHNIQSVEEIKQDQQIRLQSVKDSIQNVSSDTVTVQSGLPDNKSSQGAGAGGRS